MTAPYEWNPMPHRLDVACPQCGGRAQFEFAECVRIRLKSDIEFFEASDIFEYRFVQDRQGQRYHTAHFYPGLHGGGTSAITELPEGYEPLNWAHSQYLYRSTGIDLGSIRCRGCQYAKKHTLNWPGDAYFKMEYRGRILWAYDLECVHELLRYVEDKDRSRDGYKWRPFLREVPTHFLTAKARGAVAKRLRKLMMRE